MQKCGPAFLLHVYVFGALAKVPAFDMERSICIPQDRVELDERSLVLAIKLLAFSSQQEIRSDGDVARRLGERHGDAWDDGVGVASAGSRIPAVYA